MIKSTLEAIRTAEPALRRRMAAGAIWSIAGAGIASGCTMLANIISARVLGAAPFGEMAIVLSTTNLFTSLFTAGMGMTATRYVAEARDSEPERAGAIVGLSWATSMVVGAAAALLVILFAPVLSRQVLGKETLAVPLSLGAAAMFFAALNGSQVGTLSGFESFRHVATGNLVRGIGIVILVSAGAIFGGLNGALLGYALAGAAATIYYQLVVRRECEANGIRISYRFSGDELRVLSRFTLPVLITTFSFTPAQWWGNVLLATHSGYAEAGVFNAVLHWQLFILFFSTAVSNIGLPMLSNIRAERDPAKYKRCLALTFALTTAPAIVIAIPIAILAPWILHLYGREFVHGSTALIFISAASVLTALNIPVGHAIWSLDAIRPAVALALLRGGVLIIAAYALADKAATGLAEAYLIMAAIQTAVSIPFMFWLLKNSFVHEQVEAIAA
ncbi:MAG: oligosaccharide flippase family protein [Acidobacteriia bacterium]|nr:oligosaccharide flippase family protein [Terriglobia bacterium]